MSSVNDSSYTELCKKFADRLQHSQLAINSSLLDEDDEPEGIEFDSCNEAKAINYCWINGKRKDSDLLYSMEEQCFYVSNSKILKDGSEAYTCNVKNCGGRVHLKKNEIAVKVADHTVSHGSMYKYYMELQCRNFMREECEFSGASKSISDIYQEALIMWNNDPLCDGPFPIDFTKISKTLSNWKKEKYETSPQSCEEIKKAFENPATLKDLGTSLQRDHGLIYNHVHQEKEFSYCVLSSPKSIEIMKDELEERERFYLIDGTFRITPMCKVFKQVLVIHGQFGTKSFPLVAVLMSNRTTAAYKSVFKYIHEHLLPLNAKGIITDFEMALRSSLRSIVPDTMLLGCWFHYSQALRRKVASIPLLFKLIKKDERARELYRFFQCLALLPADKIEPAFTQVAHKALQSFPEFAKFVQYYENQWIKKETPESFSVFLQDTRTTGAAEAFNGKWGKSFKTHGNFFNFLAVFQKEEVVKANELERDINGLIQRDTKKKLYKDRSAKIEHYSKLLRDDKITVKRFLKTMANIDNKIVFDESEFPVLDVDQIEFDDSSDKELYIDILKKLNDNATVQTDGESSVASTSAATASTSAATASKNNSDTFPKPQPQPEKPILTRSKAKKALRQEKVVASSSSSSPVPPSSSSSSNKNGKRRVAERDKDENTKTQTELRSKRAKTLDQDMISEFEKRFDDIIDGKNDFTSGSSKCVMQCKRDRAMLLLPCKHQPTCKQCFVLWKLHLNAKRIDVFCPICKATTKDQIPINDD